jgi:peptidoglycan/LPS O-acetylase OafA/YrhL
LKISTYRADIDGLRAISIIAVLLFHIYPEFFSGGYIGVDVFFVISGFLITGIIYDEICNKKFSYINFYKRRIGRLLPSLLLTLFITLFFGFFFYTDAEYDRLGKEVFFSAIGAANILFGQGANYFSQDLSQQPLIHLWSLGVEEQFYLAWPTIMIFLCARFRASLLWIFTAIFLFSFSSALLNFYENPIKTFFFPHFRSFELIIGAMASILVRNEKFKSLKISSYSQESLSWISISTILASIFLLNNKTPFPGWATLPPCLATGFLLIFAPGTSVSRQLTREPFVWLGLISYPLYLFHQPIISFTHRHGLTSYPAAYGITVIAISVILAWASYKFIEIPIRRAVRKPGKQSALKSYALACLLLLIAASGLFIAKSQGIPNRFKYLNTFSYELISNTSSTFHENFRRGAEIQNTGRSKILFFGDSVLQQYVYPIIQAFNIDKSEIDLVTRGGCVMLKDLDFRDNFADISCKNLQEKLYNLKNHYDLVIFSQQWSAYETDIRNAPKEIPTDSLERWSPFIKSTIEHFLNKSDRIIILGQHITVNHSALPQPSIFLTKEKYQSKIKKLQVINIKSLHNDRTFFDSWNKYERVTVIHPEDIWTDTDGTFKLRDEKWSYFRDSTHISKASLPFLINKIRKNPNLAFLINEQKTSGNSSCFTLK